MEISYWMEAYTLAAKKADASAAKEKMFQDRKAHFTDLEPGDLVSVQNLSERGGPGKLHAHWEEQIDVVVQRKRESPVYEVKSEGTSGKSRILHRNLLLPYDFLPLTVQPTRLMGTGTPGGTREGKIGILHHNSRNRRPCSSTKCTAIVIVTILACQPAL